MLIIFRFALTDSVSKFISNNLACQLLICIFLGLEQGDPLYVKVNKLSSTKTQLPYDYYYLNYCKPRKIVNNAENLGEVLRGDRIENSVYTVSKIPHPSVSNCFFFQYINLFMMRFLLFLQLKIFSFKCWRISLAKLVAVLNLTLSPPKILRRRLMMNTVLICK